MYTSIKTDSKSFEIMATILFAWADGKKSITIKNIPDEVLTDMTIGGWNWEKTRNGYVISW